MRNQSRFDQIERAQGGIGIDHQARKGNRVVFYLPCSRGNCVSSNALCFEYESDSFRKSKKIVILDSDQIVWQRTRYFKLLKRVDGFGPHIVGRKHNVGVTASPPISL